MDDSPISGPTAKPAFRYWFWRLYVLVLLPLMAFTIGWFAYEVSSRHDFRLFPFCAASALLLLPTIRLGLALRAFPFDYSPFGWYFRSPPPDEAPVTVFRQCILEVGAGMRAQATVTIYPSGLSIKFYLTGSVFLPLKDTERLEQTRWSGTVVHHHCPEVRTPITLPVHVGRVVEELAGIRQPAAS